MPRATYGAASGVLAISYSWKSKEHPDPDGALLQMLAPILAWYMCERARKHPTKNPDFGVFADFWSLYQGERTPEQGECFGRALSSMDMWYAHAGSTVLRLSKQPKRGREQARAGRVRARKRWQRPPRRSRAARPSGRSS